jgi:hypothetical protein
MSGYSSFWSNVTTQATKAAQALATEYKQATAAPPPGYSNSSSDSVQSSTTAPSPHASSPSPGTQSPAAGLNRDNINNGGGPIVPGGGEKRKVVKNVSEVSKEELVSLVQKLQKRLEKANQTNDGQTHTAAITGIVVL